MLSPRARVPLALALTVLIGACLAPPAGAGEYDVNVCRHADGTPAPTDGWQLIVEDDFNANDTAQNSCPIGGQVDLALGAGTAHGRFAVVYSGARVAFVASPPAGAAWSRVQAWWAFRSNPVTSADGSDLIAGSVGSQSLCSWGRSSGGCSARGTFAGGPTSAANVTAASVPPAEANQPLAVSAVCDSSPLACPSASGDPYAELRAWRLAVTLSDPSAPTFAAQPALPVTVTDATVPTTISATDAGSGVHTARLLVDGTPVGAAVVVDAAGGTCARRADGSFDALAPCPASVGGAPVALDASTVANGRRQLAVRIADASGNVADSQAATVTVNKPPPPVPIAAIPKESPLRGKGHVHNGSGSAETGTLTAGLRAGSRAKLRTSARILPGRSMRLSGRLTGADRKAVGRAVLVVRSTFPGRGAQVARVTTRSDGTYTRTLSWGKSRRVSVRWYPFGDSIKPVSSRTLRVLGAGRISLDVLPRFPRNNSALRFSGTAFGAPAGARVTIQVRTGGLWRTFLTPLVDRRGHFIGKRLLTRSAGVSYCLRARILSQPGFAYSAGFSRPTCRRVRG